MNKWILLLTILILLNSCGKNEIERDGSENECIGQKVSDRFIVDKDGFYVYQSLGGAEIKVKMVNNAVNVLIHDKSFPHFTYELWEDVGWDYLHENLNGKHIKDRLGSNRTILFPDGTKVTLVASGVDKKVTSVSIYDGAFALSFNTKCNLITYSKSDAVATKLKEAEELDGETSTFEIIGSYLHFYNIYDEVIQGEKNEVRIDLGNITLDNIHQVNDLFDDPRLAHT